MAGDDLKGTNGLTGSQGCFPRSRGRAGTNPVRLIQAARSRKARQQKEWVLTKVCTHRRACNQVPCVVAICRDQCPGLQPSLHPRK